MPGLEIPSPSISENAVKVIWAKSRDMFGAMNSRMWRNATGAAVPAAGKIVRRWFGLIASGSIYIFRGMVNSALANRTNITQFKLGEVGKKMNDICLVNFHPQNSDPLMSITRLPENEALELARQLSKQNPVPGYKDRFGTGFISYFHHRIKTEKWLYKEFISIGGKPQTAHPLYFFVHAPHWNVVGDLKLWKTERIALSKIDICDVSFLVGDSCSEVDKPDRNTLFLKDELLNRISLNGNDVEKFIESVKQKYGISIEAHIWNDKYFR